MSGTGIFVSVVVAFIANEASDVSPWLALRLVCWSAALTYPDAELAMVRSEELKRVIEDRPGKLFKLLTAVGFVAAAVVKRFGTRPLRIGGQLVSGAVKFVASAGAILVAPFAFVVGTVGFSLVVLWNAFDVRGARRELARLRSELGTSGADQDALSDRCAELEAYIERFGRSRAERRVARF